MLCSGGLAQLARASALQAEGQRFESVILHDSGDWKDGRSERSERSQSLKILHEKEIFDMLDIKSR